MNGSALQLPTAVAPTTKERLRRLTKSRIRAKLGSSRNENGQQNVLINKTQTKKIVNKKNKRKTRKINDNKLPKTHAINRLQETFSDCRQLLSVGVAGHSGFQTVV